MGQTTSPPRRPRHAAMRDDGGSYDYRERPRSGRGVTSSDRPGSPPHGARLSSDYDSRHHHRPRDSAPAHRHRSRDRSRDYSRRDKPASSRPPVESEDLIPRYRESKARSSETKTRTTRGSRSRSRDRDRDRGGLGSPSSSKRHRSRSRSRSRSLSPSRRKRYKKTHSPPPRSPARSSKAESRRRRHHSTDRRDSSPRRHRSSHKSPSRADDTRHHSRRRSPPHSPARSEAERRHSRRDSSRHHHKSEAPRSISRNRSPLPTDKRRSLSNRRDSQSRVAEPTLAVRTATDDQSRVDAEYRSANRDPRPRSPQAHRERKRGKDLPEPHHTSRSDIDDDMTSRSSYRGGYNPTYSHQSHHSNDPRGFSQSPQNSGSFHNSPSPSSYGAGRSGWNGHQYSPQQYVFFFFE
jgi:CTD kinase subunit alpha